MIYAADGVSLPVGGVAEDIVPGDTESVTDATADVYLAAASPEGDTNMSEATVSADNGDGGIILPELDMDPINKTDSSTNSNTNSSTSSNTDTGSDGDTETGEIDMSESLSSAVVSTKYKSYTYNGYVKKPAVTVVLKGKTLVKGTDYTVAYKNNRNVGTARIIVTGIGNYTGTASGSFKITAKSIAGATVKTKSKSYVVTGSYRKPKPTVTLSGKTLTLGTDYTLSYANNKNAGTATITVKGKGNYTGTAKGTFKLYNKTVATVPVYRLFNTVTGEHFYTVKTSERSSYIKAGWKAEGIAWYAPKTSKTPIYRVSNPNNGNEHHYTKSKSEKNWLVSLGWNDEGIGWYSDDNKTVPVYRHYHPKQSTGNHHYTTSKGESNYIVKNEGWKYEGISWYAAKLP